MRSDPDDVDNHAELLEGENARLQGYKDSHSGADGTRMVTERSSTSK
jgi:hypothetical protein